MHVHARACGASGGIHFPQRSAFPSVQTQKFCEGPCCLCCTNHGVTKAMSVSQQGVMRMSVHAVLRMSTSPTGFCQVSLSGLDCMEPMESSGSWIAGITTNAAGCVPHLVAVLLILCVVGSRHMCVVVLINSKLQPGGYGHA